jgi:hypothetical protein
MPAKRPGTGVKKRKAYYYYAGKETKAKKVAKKTAKKPRKKATRKPRKH